MNAVTGHTPGPWRVCYDGQIDAVDGSRVCTFGWDSYREFNEGNNAANARLIAAAPIYYAATDVLLEVAERGVINDPEGFGRAIRMFREAHAKATGASA